MGNAVQTCSAFLLRNDSEHCIVLCRFDGDLQLIDGKTGEILIDNCNFAWKFWHVFDYPYRMMDKTVTNIDFIVQNCMQSHRYVPMETTILPTWMYERFEPQIPHEIRPYIKLESKNVDPLLTSDCQRIVFVGNSGTGKSLLAWLLSGCNEDVIYETDSNKTPPDDFIFWVKGNRPMIDHRFPSQPHSTLCVSLNRTNQEENVCNEVIAPPDKDILSDEAAATIKQVFIQDESTDVDRCFKKIIIVLSDGSELWMTEMLRDCPSGCRDAMYIYSEKYSSINVPPKDEDNFECYNIDEPDRYVLIDTGEETDDGSSFLHVYNKICDEKRLLLTINNNTGERWYPWYKIEPSEWFVHLLRDV